MNWLRAGVLGANDGIIPVAAPVVGVAGVSTDIGPLVVAGISGLICGAVSMNRPGFRSIGVPVRRVPVGLTRGQRSTPARPGGVCTCRVRRRGAGCSTTTRIRAWRTRLVPRCATARADGSVRSCRAR
nr:VIT1/CCC1 transporter family protein [Pseudarthrobacter albicanus]